MNEFGYFPEAIAKSFLTMVRKMNIWHDPRNGRFTSRNAGATIEADFGNGQRTSRAVSNKKLTSNDKIQEKNNEKDYPKQKNSDTIISPTGLSPFGANDSKGFDNKKKKMRDDGVMRTNAEEHFKRHGREFGEGITLEEYNRKGIELFNKPIGGNILGYYLKEKDQVCRFDITTGQYVKGDKDRGLATNMIAKHGEKNQLKKALEYYNRKLSEEGGIEP